ncbi:unnamed protein product [Camellia sinensis]
MRTQNSPILVIFFIITLLLVHIASCRHIHQTRNEEAEQRLRAKYFSTFSKYLSAIHARAENRKNNSPAAYEVSHRTVPCGPNPLHN